MSTIIKAGDTRSGSGGGAGHRRARLLCAGLAASAGLAVGVQAVAAQPASAWSGILLLDLKAEPQNQLLGQSVKLTASTQDVGSTPYYIQIFDQATGNRLAYCGSGSTCSATTPAYGYATTRTYVAYVARAGATNPPPDIQTKNSISVSWRSNLVLNTTLLNYGAASIKATSATDVGPTPNYIYILDVTTNTHLKRCGTGTTCEISKGYYDGSTRTFRAYVAPYTAATTGVPPGAVYSSNDVSVYFGRLG